MYPRLIIVAATVAITGMPCLMGCTSQETREAEMAIDDWTADSRFDLDAFVDDATAHAAWVRDFGHKERTEYVQTYALKEIAKEFPVHAGMTIREMDDAIAENERRFVASELAQREEMYNLGWEQRSIQNGSGWVYFWVNFKHLFHCDIVIDSGKVQSVWVMPGNKEWQTGIYYRISGAGVHKGPGRIW
jgi:hypothetical protein